LQDAFLSILPQAKYKDYRSKSQDLHCPAKQLREVNLLYRFTDQVNKRYTGLTTFSFSRTAGDATMVPIACEDFREFLEKLEKNSVDLIITDPPWTDGNAYFEKAQLYHPWLEYDLKNDAKRLSLEYVVTDAPSRQDHSVERWWQDTEVFFELSYNILRDFNYFALFFRPIPASQWLTNLNGLKLAARKAGFEPLLSIDVASSDPSMRIQQSASYVFSTDVIMLFIKLPKNLTRIYYNDIDVDQLVYQVSEETQEGLCGPFTFKQWRDAFGKRVIEIGAAGLNAPKNESTLSQLFWRYCEEIKPGLFLPRANTPFSGQLFDIPAIERLFTYVPHVINELTKNNSMFSYDRFLLSLSEFVENGTRMLIDQIEHLDLRKIILKYAEPLQSGRYFRRRKLPKLPHVLRNILELDPYEFEAFVGHLLEAMNFTSVCLLGRAGDRGVDLSGIDPEGKITVVQCKRYVEHKVSANPVQRLHSFAVTRGAERKILITTSGFTREGKDEARITNTELIDRRGLEQLVSTHLPTYF
jgi:restriction system protein